MVTKSANFPANAKVAGYKPLEHDVGGMPAPAVKPSKSLQEKTAINVFNEKGTVKHSTPVTIGKLGEPKTSGIKMRGAGAATKGFMSRGPMA